MRGYTERHHFVSKRSIRARRSHVALKAKRFEELSEAEHRLLFTPLSRILADERNLVTLTPIRHHRVTHGFEKLSLDDVPQIREFAAEYALEPALERKLAAFTNRA